jgi:hypothetical protein
MSPAYRYKRRKQMSTMILKYNGSKKYATASYDVLPGETLEVTSDEGARLLEDHPKLFTQAKDTAPVPEKNRHAERIRLAEARRTIRAGQIKLNTEMYGFAGKPKPPKVPKHVLFPDHRPDAYSKTLGEAASATSEAQEGNATAEVATSTQQPDLGALQAVIEKCQVALDGAVSKLTELDAAVEKTHTRLSELEAETPRTKKIEREITDLTARMEKLLQKGDKLELARQEAETSLESAQRAFVEAGGQLPDGSESGEDAGKTENDDDGA